MFWIWGHDTLFFSNIIASIQSSSKSSKINSERFEKKKKESFNDFRRAHFRQQQYEKSYFKSEKSFKQYYYFPLFYVY